MSNGADRQKLPRSQHRWLGGIYSTKVPLLPAANAFLELARTDLE